MFRSFYNFVKNTMQGQYLYQQSSKEFLIKVKEDFEHCGKYVVTSESGEADISYYKMRKKSIDGEYTFRGETNRPSKLIKEVLSVIDQKRFNSSCGPNIVHCEDSGELCAIETELGLYFITIHDCYLVDILSCTDLVRAKLKHYRNAIPGYRIENIFILL
jgi:hypothetical protein